MNTSPLISVPRQYVRLLNLFLCGLLSVCAFPARASAHYLFVVTPTSNGVTVIDSKSDEVAATIAVGDQPIRISPSLDRSKAYVSNQQSGTVSVIDTSMLNVTNTINVGVSPQESAVSPDGQQLFVVHQAGPYVTVVDTASEAIITQVYIGGGCAKRCSLSIRRALRLRRELL